MERSQVLDFVYSRMRSLAQDKGFQPGPVGPDTVVLGGDIALDSLDLAAIVVELQDLTGTDPFQGGFIEFRTAGELATLFATSA
jgi:acyl carrier protein